MRFNRYMVECEYKQARRRCGRSNLLIDTWWNVNWNQVVPDEYVIAVLIDTWWNVNKQVTKILERKRLWF